MMIWHNIKLRGEGREGTDLKFPRTSPDEQEKRDGRHQDREDEVQEVGR